MPSFESAFLQHIGKHRLLTLSPGKESRTADRTLLAVSGGLDSMAMSDLFVRYGWPVGIAHVNFKLRGKESDGDAKLVRGFAEKHGLPYYELPASTRHYAREHRLSIQEAAREIRYRWLASIARDEGYQAIATAHHLDDSVETFFVNLLRGSGIRGLDGIPVRTGQIIRPMLFAGRAEIERYVKRKRITFREDSSNRKDDYLRNRIRHHLIPLLETWQPSFKKTMAGNLVHLSLAAHALEEHTHGMQQKLMRKKGDRWEISIPGILEYPYPEPLLFDLLRREGFVAHEPEKMLQTGLPGAVFVANGKELIRDRQKLILQEKKPRVSVAHEIKASGVFDVNGHTLNLTRKKYKTGMEWETGSGEWLVDADRVMFPLTVRTWKTGDRIRPLGMKQQQKISDLLTNLKVSAADRKDVHVMVSQGEIVCILGVRISDSVKVCSDTRHVLSIRWSSENHEQ